jgi:hypothetical protein
VTGNTICSNTSKKSCDLNADMDTEDQSDPLLAPTAEYLASVTVFPLIPYLKKDVIVSLATVFQR